jgi:hypothetical protein
MTTTDTGPAETLESAIEEQMGRLTNDLASSLAVLTISLGTRSGL